MHPRTFLSIAPLALRLSLHPSTAAISRASAENIAQAAQAFGQEHDITVLTLQRTVPS
jgi:hypothetical protein